MLHRKISRNAPFTLQFAYILLACLAIFVTVPGCGKKEASEQQTFRLLPHVVDGPEYVRAAAEAVVLIAAPNGSTGTGSFVTKDGILLTNHHVLSTKNCPTEGCFAEIRFKFQKGAAYESKRLFFALPLYSDSDLDVSFLQLHEVTQKDLTQRSLYLSADAALKLRLSKADKSSLENRPFPNGVSTERFQSPAFLEIDSVTGEELLDKQVTMIGHHLSGLKKFLTSTVAAKDEFQGVLRTITFPGSSGSPLITENKKIVGIHHSSLVKEQAITSGGYRSEAFFTTGEFLARSLERAQKARDGQQSLRQSLALLSQDASVANIDPFRYSNIEVNYALPISEPAPTPSQPAPAAALPTIITLRTVYQYKCLDKSGLPKPESIEQKAWDFAIGLGENEINWDSGDSNPSATAEAVCVRAVKMSPCRFPVDSTSCANVSEPLRKAFAARAKASLDDYKSLSYYWSVTAPAIATDTNDSKAKELAVQFEAQLTALTPQAAWDLTYDGIYSFKGNPILEFVTSQDLGRATEKETEALIGTVTVLAIDKQLDMSWALNWLTTTKNRKDISMSNLAFIETYLDYALR